MPRFLVQLQAMLADRDRGATAVEYGLMVALIAVAIIMAVTALGDELIALFGRITDGIASTGGGGG